MLTPVERDALRRLGGLKVLLGLGGIAVIAARAHASGQALAVATLVRSAPAAFGIVFALTGLVLLVSSFFAQRTAMWRTVAAVIDLGAVAVLFGGGAHEATPFARPDWWNAELTPALAIAVTVINCAGAPLGVALTTAAALAVAGWYGGYLLVAAGAAGCALVCTGVAAPFRRQGLPADLPNRLAHAAGQGEARTNGAGAADATPLGEADLRAAAATLAIDDLALLVHDVARRQRTPSGDLHALRGGRYTVQRVILDAAHAQEPNALGFFAPAGMIFPERSRVKLLTGQAGVVGRVVLPGWSAGSEHGQDTTRDALLALVAATWSLRLDNYRLARDADARLLDIVESLITSVEAKDLYTSGHSKRVCKYSLLIAENLGFAGRDLDDVAIGAALHDVGKLGIPEQLLSKPAKLDDAEWGVVRSHPKVGARIIDSFNQSDAVLHMIFHHHERFDGTGYPAKLAGEDIPLVARIVGVADALDAMTSGRVYQRNRTVRDAVNEVRANAGSQFDPRVVEALLRVPLAKLEEVAPELPVAVPAPELPVPLRPPVLVAVTA